MPRTARSPLTPEAVRARLRELIADAGLSISAVAAKAGMPLSQLSDILTGRRPNPTITTIARILRALDKTWRDLDWAD